MVYCLVALSPPTNISLRWTVSHHDQIASTDSEEQPDLHYILAPISLSLRVIHNTSSVPDLEIPKVATATPTIILISVEYWRADLLPCITGYTVV